MGQKGDHLDHRQEKDWESICRCQNAKGCSKTTITGHDPGLGLLVLVQFVKPISERVEVRYSQDMERKEVSEGHSLWLGQKERKKASVVQVCHSSEANMVVSPSDTSKLS